MLSGLFLTYKDSFIDFVTNALFLFECVVVFFFNNQIGVSQNFCDKKYGSIFGFAITGSNEADGYLTLNLSSLGNTTEKKTLFTYIFHK